VSSFNFHIHKDITALVGKVRFAPKGPDVFVFQILKAGEINLTHENQIFHFIELLGAFVGNQLDTNEIYSLLYKGLADHKGGCRANIVSKNKQKYLRLTVDTKEYFLSKYECRIIVTLLKKILSKCTLPEFSEYAR